MTTSQPIEEKQGPKQPEDVFEQLREMVSQYMDEDDLVRIRAAFDFAVAAHEGQFRKSGEPFVIHPVEVAKILADLRMDAQTICAALLHDTVEDTKTTPEEVEELFGSEVRELVEGVTKITRIEVENLTDEQADTIRKMFVAMSKDIRVIVIKLADRLHNMRTLSSLPEDRRIFKARETLEIYAPIAHRLGINSIKWVLEDLAFFHLEPNKYKQVSRMVTDTRQEREAYLSDVIDVLSHEMKSIGVDARIMGRPKHLYSIYQKMMKKGKGFSEIFDLIAVRIIVDSVKDCYTALGSVHNLWHPMPGRFKDYIAMPKYNMYQSLHTTVIGPSGRPLEVQIRTEEMHKASEYGVAAHWRYKEGGGKVDTSELDKQLAWLREVVDWQDETQDSREFLKSLKMDLDNSEVYVFTPNGEVKTLRAGSTPVDFAYAIHTEVGNHCVGAKVNGSIVPLTYELKTGDRAEILTSKNSGPSRDWLNFVKTPSARNKIRGYFSKATRATDIQDGHSVLMREMRKHGFGLSNARTMRAMKDVAVALGFNDVDDMLVQLARGKESPQHIANRLIKQLEGDKATDTDTSVASAVASVGVKPPMITQVATASKRETHSSNGIVVKGLDDVLVRLSRCCNPVPGDEILGFVTRGRGVSVHRADCPNARDLRRDPNRIIDVAWDGPQGRATVYKVEIHLEALDRLNLLLDVTAVLSEVGANVLSCSTNTHKDSVVEMRFLFQIGALDKIDLILTQLRKVEGVFDAHRV
jgi:GTP pyrophosphokinase